MPENELKIEPLTAPPPTLTAGEEAPTEAKKSFRINWQFFSRRKNKADGSIDVFKAVKYIYPLTICLIVLILIWVMSFLYNNVYLTMAQAEIVSNLKSKVIEESVDFSKFSAIAKKISDKKNLSAWPYLNFLASPFAYGARTSYPDAVPSPLDPIATSSLLNIASTTKSTSTGY